jgi:glycosyltransferase involved in cell wall biosynthesis
MNPLSGYGIVNLEYATALERLTGSISVGWERREDMLDSHWKLLSQEQKELLSKPYTKERVGIIKTTPQLFERLNNEFRIGYTMVENTKMGKHWVEACNRMDAILVPSKYLIQVFKDSGVTVPIRSVKQGIDSRRFKYVNRPKKKVFTFGTIGYMDERKNWKDLAQAFCSEFEEFEPVELVIKNSNKYFEHMTFHDRRIRVINDNLHFDEITNLYSTFDCFVFPSHAEGSGLPPREAMATGLPTILTNWSGLEEICNPEFNYPLTPVSIDYPDDRGNEQPGFQARLSVPELMYYMRYVYEHQEEARDKGRKASEYIHKEYNWDTCAKDLLEKVKEVSNG